MPGGGRAQLNVRVGPEVGTALAQLAADLGELFGTATSQGDALAWLLEVGAAEIERLRLLKATAPPASTAACPWQLTARAIREYQVIAGCDRERAERELAEIAARCADPARTAEVRQQDNGLTLYRGPRPLRLRLLVAPAGSETIPHAVATGRRPRENVVVAEIPSMSDLAADLPALVQVLPASPRGSRPEGAGAKERQRARRAQSRSGG